MLIKSWSGQKAAGGDLDHRFPGQLASTLLPISKEFSMWSVELFLLVARVTHNCWILRTLLLCIPILNNCLLVAILLIFLLLFCVFVFFYVILEGCGAQTCEVKCSDGSACITWHWWGTSRWSHKQKSALGQKQSTCRDSGLESNISIM